MYDFTFLLNTKQPKILGGVSQIISIFVNIE